MILVSYSVRNANCNFTRLTVVKTIRLHFNGLLSWIHKHPTLKVNVQLLLLILTWIQFQIIHLIRDPRSQIRSRLKFQNSFVCEKEDVPGYCSSVEEDLRLGSRLSPSLYKLVRYEDLTKDPLTVMTDLYQFIGVNLTTTVRNYIVKKVRTNTDSDIHFEENNVQKNQHGAGNKVCRNLLTLGNFTRRV